MASLRLQTVCIILFTAMSGLGPLGATSSFAAGRSFFLSLPIISVGRAGLSKAEFNLMGKGTAAVEWSMIGLGEELRKDELKNEPADSLLSQGQELGLSFSRYTRPAEMAGAYWTLGTGFRRLQATWHKSPLAGALATDGGLADTSEKVDHSLDISGTTISGRVGYRYVGQSLGFAAGIYLGIKHFQNRVSDRDNKGSAVAYSPIAHHDALVLKRRLMSSLQPGIELGWAF